MYVIDRDEIRGRELAVRGRTLLAIQARATGGGEVLLQSPCSTNTPEESPVLFPMFILPRAAVRSFYGREEIFKQLDEILDSGLNPDRLRSVLLHGMAGVGKTSTALQYAHQTSAYDAVFWIGSETEDAMQQSLKEIAVALKLPGALENAPDQKNLHHFKNWLRTQESLRRQGDPRAKKWLFILDNCENLDIINEANVLTTSGSVIITSRLPNETLEDTTKLLLAPFPKNDSHVLLKRLLVGKKFNDEEECVLGELLEYVNGVPLGIKILAAMIRNRKNSLVEYKEYFEKYKNKLLGEARMPKDYYGTGERNKIVLNAVWHTNFKDLASEEKSLLGMISFIAPDKIFYSLFQPDHHKQDPSALPVCDDEFVLDKATNILLDSGLIDIDKSESDHDSRTFLSVHRLIQDAFICYCEPDERQKYFNAVAHIVSKAFPKQEMGAPMELSFRLCGDLIEHVVSLVRRLVEFRLQMPAEFEVKLKDCARYLYEKTDIRGARYLLEILKTSCADRDNTFYADLLNVLGAVYYETNNIEKCREVWAGALERKKVFAKSGDHEAEEILAVQLSNCGNIETSAGNLGAALSFFRESEAIRLRRGETWGSTLGLVYIGMGRAYFMKGELDEVEPRYRKAEEIFKKAFGRKSLYMAHVQYARGNLEIKRKNNEQALKFYTEALGMVDEVLMDAHLLEAAILFKMGCLHIEEKRYKDAKKSLAQGFNIADKRKSQGEMARNMRKQHHIYSVYRSEPSCIALQEVSMEDVTKSYETSREMALRAMSNCHGPQLKLEDEDECWNKLLCGYYR